MSRNYLETLEPPKLEDDTDLFSNYEEMEDDSDNNFTDSDIECNSKYLLPIG
jgi:hypothetical protein